MVVCLAVAGYFGLEAIILPLPSISSSNDEVSYMNVIRIMRLKKKLKMSTLLSKIIIGMFVISQDNIKTSVTIFY